METAMRLMTRIRGFYCAHRRRCSPRKHENTKTRKHEKQIVQTGFRAFVLSCFRAFVLSCFRAFVLSWFRGFVVSWFRGFVAKKVVTSSSLGRQLARIIHEAADFSESGVIVA